MSASCVPGRTHRLNCTGSEISAAIIKGSPLASSSSVAGTEPSTEFSMGTKAAAASPWRTASSAEVTEPNACVGGCGSSAASRSNNAACEKVPSGPRVSNRCHVHEPIALRSPGAWGFGITALHGPAAACIVADMQDPLIDLGFARVDTHRAQRTGDPRSCSRRASRPTRPST